MDNNNNLGVYSKCNFHCYIMQDTNLLFHASH